MGSQSRLAGFCHFYVSIQNDRKTTHLRTTSIFLLCLEMSYLLQQMLYFSVLPENRFYKAVSPAVRRNVDLHC